MDRYLQVFYSRCKDCTVHHLLDSLAAHDGLVTKTSTSLRIICENQTSLVLADLVEDICLERKESSTSVHHGQAGQAVLTGDFLGWGRAYKYWKKCRYSRQCMFS